jgi:hypothetical protein
MTLSCLDDLAAGHGHDRERVLAYARMHKSSNAMERLEKILNSRWCPSGRRDGVKIGVRGCGVCAWLGLLPLRGRGRHCLYGFAALAGPRRVKDGRGRLLTPSLPGGPDPAE